MRLLALLFAAVTLTPFASRAQSAPELVAQGRVLLDSGKFDGAAKLFERALKLDEKNSNTHMLLAQALGNIARKSNVFKQGLMARRIKNEMERARELDPKSLDPHEGLIDYYLEAPGVMGGSVAKARLEAAEIAKLNRLRGHFAVAKVALHEEDSATAEREYRAAVADDPDSLQAYITLGSYFFDTKRWAESFAVFDEFSVLHPANPMGTYYIGRISALTGMQLDRGEAALRKYLALPYNSADRTRAAPASAHFRLGEILVKKGNKAEARKEFETALRLNPNLQPARTALKALQ